MRYPHSQLFTITDEAIAGRVFDACFIGLFRTACLFRGTFEFIITITKESVRICRCFAVIKYTSARGNNIFLTESIISRCNRRISCKCLCYQYSDPLYFNWDCLLRVKLAVGCRFVRDVSDHDVRKAVGDSE